jgi:hypothetical protein
LLVHDCLDREERLRVHEQLLRHGLAGKFELIHMFAVQCGLCPESHLDATPLGFCVEVLDVCVGEGAGVCRSRLWLL